MSLPEDLSRFLFLVPFVAQHEDGVPVDELCARLSLKPTALRRLVERVAMVGAPDGGPDEMVEIYLEGDRVFVALPQRFTRPPRFSVEEMLALLLALAPLRESGLPSLKAQAEALTQRLVSLSSTRAENVAPALKDRIVVHLDGNETPAHLRDLEIAVHEKRVVDAEYWTASRESLNRRELRPLGLLQIRGAWYVVSSEGKTFKVERFRSVALTETHFEAPDVDLETLRCRLESGGAHKGTNAQPEEPVRVFVGGEEKVFHGAGPGLRRWIRSARGNASLLAPEPERRALISETEALLRRYQ